MGTSIPCQETTRDRLKDIRDGEFRSWDEFLHALADTYEGLDTTDAESEVEIDAAQQLELAAIDGLEDTFGSVESSVETIEERTGRIERQLEDLQR